MAAGGHSLRFPLGIMIITLAATPVVLPVTPAQSASSAAQDDSLGQESGESGPPANAAIQEVTLAYQEEQLVAQAAANASPAPDVSEPPLPASEETSATTIGEATTARRFHYHVSLGVRQVYDDNINLGQTNRQGDFYTYVEPMIELGLGESDANFLEFTYSPNAYFFFHHTEDDAVQHLISLTAQYRLPLLTLNLSQDVQILDGTGLNTAAGTGTDFTRTNLDVSGRTRLNIYTTRLSGNYSLTGKTFLTSDLSYSVSDYATLISSSVLSGNFYLNYTYSPKLSVGLGFSGGYDEVGAPGQNQTFEQINARASYELTGKVSATLSAGVEFRQAIDHGTSGNGSPVFEGNLFYQPFDGTSLALNLSRRTQNSAVLAGQDFHSTEVVLSGRQRFLQRVFLGLSLGYQNSSYFSTISGLPSNREDDYYFLQASIDLNLTEFWTAGVFYLYRRDDSSLAFYSFYDNQYGFRTSLTF